MDTLKKSLPTQAQIKASIVEYIRVMGGYAVVTIQNVGVK